MWNMHIGFHVWKYRNCLSQIFSASSVFRNCIQVSLFALLELLFASICIYSIVRQNITSILHYTNIRRKIVSVNKYMHIRICDMYTVHILIYTLIRVILLNIAPILGKIKFHMVGKKLLWANFAWRFAGKQVHYQYLKYFLTTIFES